MLDVFLLFILFIFVIGIFGPMIINYLSERFFGVKILSGYNPAKDKRDSSSDPEELANEQQFKGQNMTGLSSQ
jgi:hypothetical protein